MKRLFDGVPSDCAAGAMPPLPNGVPGVFETVLWRNREPVFWPAHWLRFMAGCRWHGFEPPCNEATVLQAARDLTAANAIASGLVRFAAYRGDTRLHCVIDAGPPRPHMAKPAFQVNWGPALPPPTADRAYKHLGRAHWLDALRRAREAACDETLLCDAAGTVVEGAVSNLFVVAGGTLRTPALDAGPLPGVIRAELLAVARSCGCKVEELRLTRADVERADEVWLTNSLIGIRPVAAIDGKPLPSSSSLLPKIRGAWHAVHGWDPGLPV